MYVDDSRNRRGIILEGVSDSVLTGAEDQQASFESSPLKRFYKTVNGAQMFGMIAIDAFIGINYSPGVPIYANANIISLINSFSCRHWECKTELHFDLKYDVLIHVY